MREPNFSSTAQNRAAIVISSTLYDRRALDCTATLPLVNSLTHLAYMTSTSPRIREILATDGGLERLVNILATCQHTDKHSLWKWSLAFQSVVNVGVRGTEAIRTHVLESGAVHIVLAILKNFIGAIDQAKLDKDQQRKQQTEVDDLFTTALNLPTMSLEPSRSTPVLSYQQSEENRFMFQNDNNERDMLFVIPKRHTFLKKTVKPKKKPNTASLSSIPLLNNLSTDAILHREEDILLSLQLLAYLSKYPQIRQAFHSNYQQNVFSVVEKFTHRIHPADIIYWAGVIMRNACRKDEGRGGVRQCANMQCGKWERVPREFAKCRRCRKAKYCSKACQSKAWADGHRWWCVERLHSGHHPNSTATSSTAAAVVAATPPPPPPTDQVVHLEGTSTSDVITIPIEPNDTNTDEGNSASESDTTRSSSRVNETTSLHPPREQEILFYHQSRNQHIVRSIASGSSTEVEGDTEASRPRDLMDVD
ncbi:hypothetical protein G6F46_009121 [Rhizopus delemar]|nr:hypothetical protein G6F55_007911 [Rhizopus delemar]KAG1539243.1 hypothetical protein G6F51_009258 [Rhizopus arrhizus]KAG1493465.1 hypothetical protein G6F54_008556 [Rhizopus delemar]KAG1507511.1 hypothetical protein G6F53_008894 [Rhizopus delemar]KAG1522684.1 hypothetical protein G6F52_005651 [Rhizopus delemar]